MAWFARWDTDNNFISQSESPMIDEEKIQGSTLVFRRAALIIIFFDVNKMGVAVEMQKVISSKLWGWHFTDILHAKE